MSNLPVLPQLEDDGTSFDHLAFYDFIQASPILNDNPPSLNPPTAPLNEKKLSANTSSTLSVDPLQPVSAVVANGETTSDPYYNISPTININSDMPQLVSSTLEFSRGFNVLSENELRDIEANKKILVEKMKDLESKLAVEIKRKLAIQNEQNNLGTTGSGQRKASGGKNLFSSKRFNKHSAAGTEAELAGTSRKILEINHEVNEFYKQLQEYDNRILRHSVAVLGYSHLKYKEQEQAQQQQQLAQKSRQVQTNGVSGNGLAKEASPNMNEISKSGLNSNALNKDTVDRSALDTLITSVSKNLSTSQTIILSSSSTANDKLKHLSDLTRKFIAEHSALRTKLEELQRNSTTNSKNMEIADFEKAKLQKEMRDLRERHILEIKQSKKTNEQESVRANEMLENERAKYEEIIKNYETELKKHKSIGDIPLSVNILQHEFRKIVKDVRVNGSQ